MSTKFVKWPPEQKAKADAYNAECAVQYQAMLAANNQPEPGAIWAICRADRNGNWTVALYGPPWVWDVEEVAEPTSCAALRVDGVVVDAPEWPVVED